MSEGTAAQLEQKRFVINPESLAGLSRLRDALPQLQEEYPFLSGFSFYGSRIKGTEKPSSDLDMRIFYDPSKSRDIFRSESVELPYVARSRKIEVAAKIFEITGFRLDSKEGLMTDISESKTDENFKKFIDHVDNFTHIDGSEEEHIDHLRLLPSSQYLFTQFFLAVGEDVYKSRGYIMDKFKLIPNGEECFQFLMKCLARMERDSNHKYQTPQYEKLPKTIEEAQHYFLNRQDPVQELAKTA